MNAVKLHTAILGAGPAGLAAAYTLAKSGQAPVVLEKEKSPGGLMRSLKHGEFTVDIGRKELYNRLARVDELWAELLGDDFRPYPHRGGLLFDGHIIEISPSFRGFRRGMPWTMFLRCAGDFLLSRIRWYKNPPKTLEEYYYQKRGRTLTQTVSQGFQEKLSGIPWSEIRLPEDFGNPPDASFVSTVKGLVARTFTRGEVNTFKGVWRHPARGTGQICDALERGTVEHGGRFLFGARLLRLDTSDGRIRRVNAECGGANMVLDVEHVISSIPAELLLSLLLQDKFERINPNLRALPSSKRTIVLAYLFFDAPPQFPHGWLNVTCRQTRIGRITNYAGIGAGMVPPGKSCLCCEFFCLQDDPFLALDDTTVADLALSECARFKLANPTKVIDHVVLRLPGADASQNRHNWMNNMRRGLLHEFAQFRNLYFVSRTDLDIATLAGIEAAEAVMSGDRTTFDRHLDPRNLPIRGGTKAFEFRNPFEQ